MAELADAHGSGPCGLTAVEVRIFLRAPDIKGLCFCRVLFSCPDDSSADCPRLPLPLILTARAQKKSMPRDPLKGKAKACFLFSIKLLYYNFRIKRPLRGQGRPDISVQTPPS